MDNTKKQNRVLLIVLLALVAAIFLAVAVVFGLGSRGEATEETPKPDGTYVLYNGKEYQYKDEIFNILCMGIDKDIAMDETKDKSRMGFADAILLVSVDTKQETMKILAIPRDSMTAVTLVDEAGNEIGTEKLQLTYQHAYGTTPEQSGELMVDAVSRLLHGIPIQRYCAINLEAIPTINDAVGGVDVVVLEDMTRRNAAFAEGAAVHLDGDEALFYVQYRDTSISGSNLMRMERQKQYVTEFLKQLRSVTSGDSTLALEIYTDLGENMSTDLSTNDMADLMAYSLEDVEMLKVPGEVQMGEEYEEYHVDDEALKALLIETFYEEVRSADQETTEETE